MFQASPHFFLGLHRGYVPRETAAQMQCRCGGQRRRELGTCSARTHVGGVNIDPGPTHAGKPLPSPTAKQPIRQMRGRTPTRASKGPITIAIRARHATTRYEVFRALAYEIDSSTPRESVIGVSCLLIDSSMHTAFTLYLYRPTLHRV